MIRPPHDPQYRPASDQPGWQGVLVGYAFVAALFLAILAVSYPLTAGLIFTAAFGLLVGVRRTAAIVRCLSVCDGISYDIAGKLQVTLTRSADAESKTACCPA